ncbi:hypothetical protein BH11ARM2_BH11ARM2_07330 [soil metagenome]
MILKPEILRTGISRPIRRSALFAALAFAIPAATLGLGPQGGSAPQTVPKPVAGASEWVPIQVLLKCKVVRTDGFKRPSRIGSAVEPRIGQDVPSHIETAPQILTLCGYDAAIGVTINGEIVKTTLRPELQSEDNYEMTVAMSITSKDKVQSFHDIRYSLRGNEWVRYPLVDTSVEFTGYQMLVQLVPVAQGT